jgi:hypothetical protein
MEYYVWVWVWIFTPKINPPGSEESDPLSKEKEGVQQYESAHRVNYMQKKG